MGADFGSVFGERPPPSLDVRMAEVAESLEALIELLKARLVPGDDTPRPATVRRPDPAEMVNAVAGLKGSASAAEIADALLPLIAPEAATPENSLLATLQKLNTKLDALDFRLKGVGGDKAFGSGGQVSVNTDAPFMIRDRSTDANRLHVDGDGRIALNNPFATEASLATLRDRDFATQATLATRASEATLATVAGSVDTVEALLADVLAELRRRPVHKVATALVAAVAGGAYATIVDFTPAVPITITGYNCDFRTLANARYRMRLTLGGTADANVVHGEELTTDANSWTPLHLSVAAGQQLRVQAFHAELAGQDIRATIDYFESP
ncbi:MAG: hypothetical protein M3Q48_14730 [Actinomycetota bacterium]|nr:hypothetical protein [Actinomycetota bacterium]